MLAERALGILHEWVQSDSLRRHCCAVADSMKHFARLGGADADLWEAVGLLHDLDYERHPNQEQSPTEGHPFVGVAWLREQGWSEEICRAILSHADYAGVTREAPLEKTLYAVDELSGLVMAVARVRPSKSIHEVDVASVKKKMKDKAFARAVNRDDIVRGAAELGMPLENVIAGVIAALQSDAERLGLAGNNGQKSEVGGQKSEIRSPMATTAGVTTREFLIGDYDRAVVLWSEVEGVEICEGDSREEIGEYLKRNPGLSRVAEDNGEIIGAVLCGHDGRRGWIYHLVVARAYRGQRVGKLLLDDCVRGLRDAGLKRAIILVAGDNPAGHKFWLREGWEDISGAIPMTKEL